MLQTNLSAFQVQQADSGPPEARVVMSARLMSMPRREVIGSTEIGRSVPARARDLESIVLALDDALGKVLKRLVEWTLAAGDGRSVS
jgi:cholesterol transport system auxiliary component